MISRRVLASTSCQLKIQQGALGINQVEEINLSGEVAGPRDCERLARFGGPVCPARGRGSRDFTVSYVFMAKSTVTMICSEVSRASAARIAGLGCRDCAAILSRPKIGSLIPARDETSWRSLGVSHHPRLKSGTFDLRARAMDASAIRTSASIALRRGSRKGRLEQIIAVQTERGGFDRPAVAV